MTSDGYMDEKHFGVIERELLELSERRRRFREAAKALAADGAESHLVSALETADRELESVYKTLFQSTYFHVPEHLRVPKGEPNVRKSLHAVEAQAGLGPGTTATASGAQPEHTQESLLS